MQHKFFNKRSTNDPVKNQTRQRSWKKKQCRNKTSTNYEHRQVGHFRTCQCLGQVQANRGEISMAEDRGTGGAGALGVQRGWSIECTSVQSRWLQRAKATVPNGVWELTSHPLNVQLTLLLRYNVRLPDLCNKATAQLHRSRREASPHPARDGTLPA